MLVGFPPQWGEGRLPKLNPAQTDKIAGTSLLQLECAQDRIITPLEIFRKEHIGGAKVSHSDSSGWKRVEDIDTGHTNFEALS